MSITSFVQEKKLTIALSGEIDHHRAKEIMQTITERIEAYLPLYCTLDFRAVTFMDSSGIAVVIHTVRRMHEMGGTLTLSHIPPQPLKVLRAAGIEKIATIVA